MAATCRVTGGRRGTGAAADFASPLLEALARREGPLAPGKRAVVEAALTLFAAQGFAATSTRMIATRAGVSEATIFRHFATKSDLLDRIVRPLAEEVLEPAITEIGAVHAATGGDLEATLREMLRRRLAIADRYAPLVRIALQELPVNPALRAALGQSMVPGVQALFARMLAAEAAAGRMPPVPPLRFMRTLVAEALAYWVTSRLLAPGGTDDMAETAAIAAHVLRGFGWESGAAADGAKRQGEEPGGAAPT